MIWYNEHSQKGQFPLKEDRRQVKPLSDECILAVMADGMGGLDHGEIAAEIAVNVIVSSLESKTQVTDSLGGSYLTNCLRGKGFRGTPSVKKLELSKTFHVRICTDGFYNPGSKDDASVIDIFGE